MHLCCGWPRGIAILLEFNAKFLVNQRRRVGGSDLELPLSWAICCQCSESVSLLLQNDSALCSDFEPDEALGRALSTENHVIGDQVIEALVDRRRRLKEFATRVLPQESLDFLDLRADRLIDEQTYLLRKELCRSGAQIPLALSVPHVKMTVYHCHEITVEVAERLYNVGFRDLNGRDYNGRTPLAAIDSRLLYARNIFELKPHLSYAAWIVSKDARLLHTPHSEKAGPLVHSAAHVFMRSLGTEIFDHRQFKQVYAGHWKALGPFLSNALYELCSVASEVKTILAVALTDNCLCACSKAGCLPFVTLLKSLPDNVWVRACHWRPSDVYWHLPIIVQLASMQDGEFGIEASFWMDIIRLETFNALGLTHTCCHQEQDCPPLHGVLDPVEADEIRDEEAALIEQLEDLVVEFEKEFALRGSSIIPFLEGYWKQKMDEVLRENPPLSPEEDAQLREIGVVVDKSNKLSKSEVIDLAHLDL